MIELKRCYVVDSRGKRFFGQAERNRKIITGSIVPDKPIKAKWMCVEMVYSLRDKQILANGFQSWSHTFMADKNTRMSRLNKMLGNIVNLQYFGEEHFYRGSALRGRCHSHEFLRVFSGGEEELFIGSLTPEKAYGIFEVNFRTNRLLYRTDIEGLTLKAGERFEGVRLFESETTAAYFKHRKLKSNMPKRIFGWTSWYNYYTQISEELLIKNINAIKDERLDLDIFQIDDGFEAHVGDWLAQNKRFPNGMKPLANRIKSAGMKPGLWLAPFVCEVSSDVFKHKDMLLKNKKGKLQVVGYNPTWSGVFYGLDIYHLETRDYLKRVFETTVKDWGYKFLKLDFLYAAAILPRDGKTRAMVMHDALALIREYIGKVPYIACGCPVGVAAGMCEYMRVGPDISLTYEDKPLKALGYRERISTRSNMDNTENRWFLNGHAFMNDPDVFILRDTGDVKLTEEQKRDLFVLNMEKSGLVFFSDDIREYDLSNKNNLEYLIKKLPHR